MVNRIEMKVNRSIIIRRSIRTGKARKMRRMNSIEGKHFELSDIQRKVRRMEIASRYSDEISESYF